MITIVAILAIIVSADSVYIGRLWRQLRRRPRCEWEIKITTPDGSLVDADTQSLYLLWKLGRRSTDGYLDLLEGYRGGVHVWMQPSGWVEPDARVRQLDGTAALPDGYR